MHIYIYADISMFIWCSHFIGNSSKLTTNTAGCKHQGGSLIHLSRDANFALHQHCDFNYV